MHRWGCNCSGRSTFHSQSPSITDNCNMIPLVVSSIKVGFILIENCALICNWVIPCIFSEGWDWIMILISIHSICNVFLTYSVHYLVENTILKLACIIWIGYSLMVQLVFPWSHIWASLLFMWRTCPCMWLCILKPLFLTSLFNKCPI